MPRASERRRGGRLLAALCAAMLTGAMCGARATTPCATACAVRRDAGAPVLTSVTFPLQSDLTPLQHAIEEQRRRLASADAEERRDALMRLGALARPEGSRAAAALLNDPVPSVRAAAAHALLALDGEEASKLLLPLVADRDEFVRREAVYALGATRSREGVPALISVLENDKSAAVRGASAVALGQLKDERAVPALIAVFSRRLPASGFFNRVRRRKVEEDEFVQRSAATSLGAIGSREAVPALIAELSDARAPEDVRREAARALGLIGDPAAIPALRMVLTSPDPYLSRLAFESLKRLDPASATRPG